MNPSVSLGQRTDNYLVDVTVKRFHQTAVATANQQQHQTSSHSTHKWLMAEQFKYGN